MRHGSFHMVIEYTQTKFQEVLLIMKRDIHVQKIVVKIQFFQLPALSHYTA